MSASRRKLPPEWRSRAFGSLRWMQIFPKKRFVMFLQSLSGSVSVNSEWRRSHWN